MVTLNRPLHTIRLSCKEVLSLSKLPYWNKSHSFIHSYSTYSFTFFYLRTFNQFYKTLLSVMAFKWCSCSVQKYNTYLGQPKSIHDWVFFWSHYICGYWNVYCSVYHSQPLESCCQSKRKPWEMFGHQQETTYNICKSSKFIFSRGFCSDNNIMLLSVSHFFFTNSLLLKKRLGEKDVWRTDCDLDSLFLSGND